MRYGARVTLWQESMIQLARSECVAHFAQRQGWLRSMADQFVGGPMIDDAISVSRDLLDRGITTSLFYLGEYVSDPEVIANTVDQLKGALIAAAQENLDVCASVDPTQIGLMLDKESCAANSHELARTVAASTPAPRHGHDTLMIDMEDAGVTQSTFDLYWSLRRQGLPVAVTVQAYLHRTAADLRELVADGAWVRLVKGAFAEPASIAARGKADRDSHYRKCASLLLGSGAKETGVYPAFATHDHRAIDEIIAMATANGWTAGSYEFEMLYGVRPELQQQLTDKGHRVRVYLPFGTDWFPYAIRRVGESPRNLGFAARALRPR